MTARLRGASAVLVTAALMALVAGDLWNPGMREWWSRHSFTGNVVSSLFVVGVSALIFDQLVARRQRKDRAVSVAVQALIVYGQARRVYDSVLASTDADDRQSAGEDMRSLANMLLTSGPSFYDDPLARQFFERLERLAGSIYRAFSAAAALPLESEIRERLMAEMAELATLADPLIARIPTEEWAVADRPVPPESSDLDERAP